MSWLAAGTVMSAIRDCPCSGAGPISRPDRMPDRNIIGKTFVHDMQKVL